MPQKPVNREILLALWKIHMLHHAAEDAEGVVGNWMLEELREHGYEVSPGTLYPMLARMVRFRWLRVNGPAGRRNLRERRSYVITAEGRKVLALVQRQLAELRGEMKLKGVKG
ncbi:MAG: PadR family transcriptional regulator [Gammaproteobacteria bacterium]|nr:PadR family transcriptional regulator [Gammaproteobacteria bacterium]